MGKSSWSPRSKGWWWCRELHPTPDSLQKNVSRQAHQWYPPQNQCHPASKTCPESYTDGSVVLKFAHYGTGKPMTIRFSIVETMNEVIILHEVSTKLGLLKALCHNRAAQHQHLDANKKHTSQSEKNSNISPFSWPQYICVTFFKTIQQAFPQNKTIKPSTASNSWRICAQIPCDKIDRWTLYHTWSQCPTSAIWKVQSPHGG